MTLRVDCIQSSPLDSLSVFASAVMFVERRDPGKL